MKIYIGPYINPFYVRWYRKYMNSRYGYGWDHGIGDNQHTQTKIELAFEKIEEGSNWILRHTLNRILAKCNFKRKVKIKLHPYDTWDTHHTLSLIILPIIKQLKVTKHGSPLVSDEDVPAELGIRSTDLPPKENKYDWDDNCHKRWEWILGELEWTFEQLANSDLDDMFFKKTSDDVLDYEIDHEALVKHNERIKRGLTLFGKNFLNLWD
jgi:hypothetical protein